MISQCVLKREDEILVFIFLTSISSFNRTLTAPGYSFYHCAIHFFLINLFTYSPLTNCKSVAIFHFGTKFTSHFGLLC